jgi:crotonobetainyl-CoA:carnitine CoA-transferase CaiB-like acyl-CoA transferase
MPPGRTIPSGAARSSETIKEHLVPNGGPLDGVRVVDISSSYAAPTATMYLADMGADVIKVEPPRGDDSRTWGPPFVGGEATWYLAANRNKRSICVDFTQAAGHATLMRLLEGADVFVENLNPAKLERLELAPEQIRERFPRLVYCALSGFGLTGPDRGRPGYDLIGQARSGLMSVTGAADGTPQRVSTAMSDVAAGTVAAFAVAAALVRQQRTGEGELVDVSLLEADLGFMAPRIASYLAGDPEPRPSGGSDSVLAIYQLFETADDPIVVAVGNDAMWLRFCAGLELPGLAADSGMRTNAERRRRRREIVGVIADRLAERPATEWLRRLAEAGVPSAPIAFLSDVVDDPQVHARNAIASWRHPVAGEVRTVMSPWLLGSQPHARTTARPAPLLGADGEDVLREAGFDDDHISKLAEDGAVWLRPNP